MYSCFVLLCNYNEAKAKNTSLLKYWSPESLLYRCPHLVHQTYLISVAEDGRPGQCQQQQLMQFN